MLLIKRERKENQQRRTFKICINLQTFRTDLRGLNCSKRGLLKKMSDEYNHNCAKEVTYHELKVDMVLILPCLSQMSWVEAHQEIPILHPAMCLRHT